MSGGMTDEYLDHLIEESEGGEPPKQPKTYLQFRPEGDQTRPGELTANLSRLSEAMIKLCAKKNTVYRDSYAKHGELLGLFSNLTRKYDRIEAIMTSGIDGNPVIGNLGDESKATTIMDLTLYGLLWLEWLAKNKPEEFDGVVKELEQWGIQL